MTFESDVVEYLNGLSKNLDRERSWLINAIVRDYARRVREGQSQIELFDPSAELATAKSA
ncbi:MAG: hypothetical protein ABIT38_20300 [Gemmatimonadaceae bacterium]